MVETHWITKEEMTDKLITHQERFMQIYFAENANNDKVKYQRAVEKYREETNFYEPYKTYTSFKVTIGKWTREKRFSQQK